MQRIMIHGACHSGKAWCSLAAIPANMGGWFSSENSDILAELRHLAVNDQIEVTNRSPLNGSGRGRGYTYSIVSCNPPQTYRCLPTAEFIGQIEDGSGNSTGQTDDLLLIALPFLGQQSVRINRRTPDRQLYSKGHSHRKSLRHLRTMVKSEGPQED